MKPLTKQMMKKISAGGANCQKDYLGCMWDYNGPGQHECCIKESCGGLSVGFACGGVDWYFGSQL